MGVRHFCYYNDKDLPFVTGDKKNKQVLSVPFSVLIVH